MIQSTRRPVFVLEAFIFDANGHGCREMATNANNMSYARWNQKHCRAGGTDVLNAVEDSERKWPFDSTTHNAAY